MNEQSTEKCISLDDYLNKKIGQVQLENSTEYDTEYNEKLRRVATISNDFHKIKKFYITIFRVIPLLIGLLIGALVVDINSNNAQAVIYFCEFVSVVTIISVCCAGRITINLSSELDKLLDSLCENTADGFKNDLNTQIILGKYPIAVKHLKDDIELHTIKDETDNF